MRYIYNKFVSRLLQQAEKISYHIIHANSSVLFDDNVAFGMFIKIFVHLLLYSAAKHKCSKFDITLHEKKYTTKELILMLTPYIEMFFIL